MAKRILIWAYYTDLNQSQQALECFKNACVNGDFDNEIGFNAYGVVSLSIGKYDDAIIAFKKLLEVAPQSYDGAVAYGYRLLHGG